MKNIVKLLLVVMLGVLSVNIYAKDTTSIHAVRGFLPNLKFKLQGANDKTYTEKDLLGNTVLLFFGYASCPDICPTTMVQLAQVVENLGEDAAKNIRIVFISVDPHRDTPEILQAYVNLFNEDAIGLTGNEKTIADIARRYRVAYQIEKPSDINPEFYEVAHSRGIYVFDTKGRARLLASDGESVQELTNAIQKIIN